MGCCLTKKATSAELRTNGSENTTAKQQLSSASKVKHKIKNIVRTPDKSDEASTRKQQALKHFPTPQPNIPLRSPTVIAAFW